MGGIALLMGFEACGVASCQRLARRKGNITRVWLGLTLGLMMMMWFPALFAFFMDFTVAAQWCGLGLAFLCALATGFFTRKDSAPARREGDVPVKLLLALVLPLIILSAYLQCTHTLREAEGALHVGQSTYGDLCLHLGIASGLRGASFPPTYTLIEGVELGYPFLSDALAASMLLFGSGLRTAFVFSGCLMMLLVYTGFVMFTWYLTGSRLAVVTAYLLMFINGGLGFIYMFDGAASDSTMLKEVFTGFYLTPTNMPALNLRWVNVICDLLIPQRTLLAGWMMLIPAMYMLTDAMRSRRRETFIALGVWAGTMPMIHTHSFLALGIISAGALISSAARAARDARGTVIRNYLIYAAIACALALPQLLKWTFPQTTEGGSLGVFFNWVNNDGKGGLIDEYFWFWIKNVGVVYLLAVPAALCMQREGRALALGALLVYLVAETLRFQPNIYDNNKLFFAAYIAVTPMVGAFIAKAYGALKGLKCRAYFLAAVIFLGTVSGAMTIGREVVSDYRLFSADEAAAGKYADEMTDADAVFLTGNHHNNPITALAGRQIVCGTGSYLYYHGINYLRQQADEKLMLENPGDNQALFEQYGVDFVYISSYERGSFDVDEEYFASNCVPVFESGNVTIYKLSGEVTEDE